MPELFTNTSKDGVRLNECPNCCSTTSRCIGYEDAVIYVCRNCKLQWAKFLNTGGYITADKRTAIHERYMNPEHVETAEYGPYKEFWRKIGSITKDTSLKILDVGCGNGLFLQDCIRRGHDARGVDADISNRDLIDPSVRALVQFCRAEDFPWLEEKFDLITFWDSFEHMPEPFKLLDLLSSRLEPDGVIFLRVNDQRDIFNWTSKVALYIFPSFGKRLIRICFNLPHHYWNFSRQAMEEMLDRINWRIIFARSTETPAKRLFASNIIRGFVYFAYTINFIFAGGKIREYFIQRKP